MSDRLPDQVDVAKFMPFMEALASRSTYVLELGVGNGNGSTRAFLRGLKRSAATGKLFISVDNDTTRPQERPDVEYWYPVYGDSRDQDTLLKVDLISMSRPPDVLYIDTEHTYEQMQRELEVWSPLAAFNTLWMFHDVHMLGTYNHMTDAIKEFAERTGKWVYQTMDEDSHGLGLMTWKTLTMPLIQSSGI